MPVAYAPLSGRTNPWSLVFFWFCHCLVILVWVDRDVAEKVPLFAKHADVIVDDLKTRMFGVAA
jgi:hypothetical protein